jgi:hypothetical protein
VVFCEAILSSEIVPAPKHHAMKVQWERRYSSWSHYEHFTPVSTEWTARYTPRHVSGSPNPQLVTDNPVPILSYVS